MSNTNNALTKEQLFACLEYDKVEIDADTIEKARNNDGDALGDIAFAYDDTLKDYSKAMAWYRLAANKNDPAAQSNIGVLYENGSGVPQDDHIAMEYYLKAAGNNNEDAMANVGEVFLEGKVVPVDKYKALEWSIKSEDSPERVEKLKKEGVHLKEEDKDKTIYQLINEAEDILREERKKKESKLTKENQELKEKHQELNKELKKVKTLNEKEIINLRRDNQKRQNETQQKQQKIVLLEQEKQNHLNKIDVLKKSIDNLDQQLKRENESSKKIAEMFEMLVQSKNNEIDLLKQFQRHSNLERELRELKRRPGERQEPVLLVDNNITTDSNSNNNNDSPNERNNQSLHGVATSVKTEESELPLCQNENKKRRVL